MTTLVSPSGSLRQSSFNTSLPGVLKNAIDRMSRPPADIGRLFGGKPDALMEGSTSGFGTILNQNAWLPVFRRLGARVWSEGRLLVLRASTVFDVNGELTDFEGARCTARVS